MLISSYKTTRVGLNLGSTTFIVLDILISVYCANFKAVTGEMETAQKKTTKTVPKQRFAKCGPWIPEGP